ncbi:MAG: hypothetical protein HQK51_14960, partial [Oligoflexia bacterium]|nr:hypothetical protein [Oligoflexia bacterium]
MSCITDSILMTPPVSSPLHPQAALPLLKGYLQKYGFKTKVIDTNILFFNWFLQEKVINPTLEEIYKNPLSILSDYDEIEKKLWERSKKFDGLVVGMRYLSMKYDRTKFKEVIKAIRDENANPFIDFYKE